MIFGFFAGAVSCRGFVLQAEMSALQFFVIVSAVCM